MSLKSLLSKHSVSSLSRQTGINENTLKRIKRGNVSPSKEERRSLYNLERREKYQTARKKGLSVIDARIAQSMKYERMKSFIELRRSGMMQYEAREHSVLPKSEVKELASKYMEIARIIARNNKVSLKYILEGMRKSSRQEQDWENYVKRRAAEKWVPHKWDPKLNDYIPVTNRRKQTEWKKRVNTGYYDVPLPEWVDYNY